MVACYGTFFQDRAPACRTAAEWLEQITTGDSSLAGLLPKIPSAALSEESAHEGEIRGITARGLKCLAHNAPAFDETVLVPSPFTEHFERVIGLFGGREERLAQFSQDPGAIAFTILEDLSVFFRERLLKQGCVPLETAESNVLKWFETCGEWSPADGTLVSDWYYVQVPARVFQYLLKQLSSPPAQAHRV